MVKVIIIAAIVLFVIYTATKGKKGGGASGAAKTAASGKSLPPKKAQNVVRENGRIFINGVDYTKDFNRSHAYFKDIIERNFSEYTIQEHVPMTQIEPGASKFFKPLDFLFNKDGKPVLAVAITKEKASKKAPIICKNHNIKYVVIYSPYENKESFVVDRINKALMG